MNYLMIKRKENNMSRNIMGLFEITGTYHKLSEKEQKKLERLTNVLYVLKKQKEE